MLKKSLAVARQLKPNKSSDKHTQTRKNFKLSKMQTSTLDDIRFGTLVSLRQARREHNKSSKSRALAHVRQIAVQVLAREWFISIDADADTATSETRAYLIEHLLPVLVLGCERVLNEAQQRSLVEANQRHDDFNPINCLAQYLMRNNPRFNNQNETSPYVKTMREMFNQLREQMLFIQGNKSVKFSLFYFAPL